MANGQYDSIGALIASFKRGNLSRRDFAKRAAAIGLSATLINQVLNVQAQAQDATPTGPQTRTEIGAAGFTANPDTSKGTIKIYSSWPMIGALEQLGGDAVKAVEAALEDFGNASGGYAIEFIPQDSGVAANNGNWGADEATDNANNAINDPDCMVYFGTYNTGEAKVSIPLTNEAGLLQISHANTGPGLTKAVEGVTEPGEPDIFYPTGVRTYCRTIPTDDIQGAAAANWAYNENGNRMAYVLHDNSPYGKGVAQVFNLAFLELGGEVLGFEGIDKGSPDYQALMGSIADSGPDMVYFGATVDANASKLLIDFRDFMSADEVIFLGPDGLINQEFIEGAGEAAEGAYITFGGVPANALEGAGADYAARMEEVLGRLPDAYAMYAYETAVVLVQAIDRAGVNDRTAIRDAVFATKDFHSLLGKTWSFLERGDTDSISMGLNQVQGGEIMFVKAI